MSKLIATVSKIQNSSSLHIVEFDFKGVTLSMMSLDLNTNIQIGTKVSLVVKPTHISIAKEFNGKISYSNQIKATIESIDNGKLLSSVKLKILDTSLESIITLEASKRLNLKVGDDVIAFINESELSIGEVM